ncbi:MAG: trypsin-like peptidase domain-containing protein [Planctomycetes bacterium]|nr:trypsin-like peptidase domain-containing protein [Planctomycetota bacterium]
MSIISALRPILLIVAAIAAAMAADDPRDAARALADKAKNTIVCVRVVVKMKIGMQGQTQDQEQKVEANGTVIDPSGLTVASASALDPTIMIKATLKKLGQQAAMVTIDSEIKDTTLVLEDGTELEGDIVLKDADLDLAFVKPRESKAPMDAAFLAARKAPARLLEPIVVVGRMAKSANHATSVTLGEVKALVKGPQPFLIIDSETAANIGCLAYTADGAPLGLIVSKSATAEEDNGGMLGMLMMMGHPNDTGNLTIVRPVDAIIELVAQAKQAKAPAKADVP